MRPISQDGSYLLDAAGRRYEERSRIRAERHEQLERLAEGRSADWRKIDDPKRVRRRLESLGLQDLVADLMASDDVLRPVARTGGAGRGGRRDGSRGGGRPGGRGGAPLATAYERILAGDDTLSARFLRTGDTVSRSVGRVLDLGSRFGFGTGFLVSPRLLMTNNHVLPSAAEAGRSGVQFDYVEESDGSVRAPTVHRLRPDLLFLTDVALDYTLVAVETLSEDGRDLEGRGWNPLIPESGKAVVGERLNIVQHPGGKPQRIALRNNELVDVVDDFLHYGADTEPGSSGSPVFNDQWELTALHHSGVPDRDDQGRILTTSGSPWDGSDATRPRIRWVANEGVRISRIVADLTRRLAGDGERLALVEQSFRDRPLDADLAPRRGRADGPAPGPSGPVVGADGVVRWTLPVQLAMRVGDGPGGLPTPALDGGLVGDPAASPGAPHARNGSPAVHVPPARGPLPGFDPDAELADALRALEDGEDRPYYDLEEDWEAYEAYYADLPEEATVEEWFGLFRDLVRQTHADPRRYDTARKRHLYPWIDLHERADGSRELRSVYSGQGFSAEEVLRQDIEQERRLRESLAELLRDEAGLSPALLQERIDALEARARFNCEHVVPQSWFGKQEPMRGDLHHLFTCEWNCNSFRSNVPYYDFARMGEESVRHDCGRREEGKFEPAASKGAVARATLYFLLRYPGEVGDAARELQRDRLPILLDWHEEHPSDEWEWHRNRGVQEAQGNRNPLIDLPGMARFLALHLGFGGEAHEGLEAGRRLPRPDLDRRFEGRGRARRKAARGRSRAGRG